MSSQPHPRSRPRNDRMKRITARLSRWFEHQARDLPWRRKRTGYTGLISEVMLQQTQVDRVVERYRDFMKRFPTVRQLAEAPEQEVLTQWRGLGYYRRARHLHAAAKIIDARYQGRVPREIQILRSLPGIGRYTAGAIASIVYGQAEPIVDGNIRRVLTRLEAYEESDQRVNEAWCWEAAHRFVKQSQSPGVFNEAMMELGATICTPHNPGCGHCPVSSACLAFKAGIQDRIPPPKRSARKQTLHLHAVVVRRAGKIYLEQRPENGLWSKMWQMPTIEAPRRLQSTQIRDALALTVSPLRQRVCFEHHLSHRHLIIDVYETTTRVRRGTWRSPDDLADLPMSNAHRKVLVLVGE